MPKEVATIPGRGKLTKKETEYIKTKKFSWEEFKKTIPPVLWPQKFIIYILAGIFFICLAISLLNFPLGQLFSGDMEMKFGFGWPYYFFVLDMGNPERVPIDFLGMILDLIIYLFVAYIINVLVNWFLNSPLYRDYKNAHERARVYKIKEEKANQLRMEAQARQLKEQQEK